MTVAPVDQRLREALPIDAYDRLVSWCQRTREIRLDRWLTKGRSGAQLAVVVVQERDSGPQKLVMKYLPSRERTAFDFAAHKDACRDAPSGFRPHLVDAVYDGPVTVDQHSTIMFMEYGTDGRYEYETLHSLLGTSSLGAACKMIMTSALVEWNRTPVPFQAGVTSAANFLAGIAGWTCAPGKPLHDWLARSRPELLDRASLRIRWETDLLPNPVVLARDGGGLEGLTVTGFRGRVHGDLHVDNILVPRILDRKPTGRDFGRFRLIDLSTYQPEGILTAEPAYLLASIVAHSLPQLHAEQCQPLIHLILDPSRSEIGPIPIHLHRAVDGLQKAGLALVTERKLAAEWRLETLLAIAGCALLFAGRDTTGGDEARWWFFELSARAAKAYLDAAQGLAAEPTAKATAPVPLSQQAPETQEAHTVRPEPVPVPRPHEHLTVPGQDNVYVLFPGDDATLVVDDPAVKFRDLVKELETDLADLATGLSPSSARSRLAVAQAILDDLFTQANVLAKLRKEPSPELPARYHPAHAAATGAARNQLKRLSHLLERMGRDGTDDGSVEGVAITLHRLYEAIDDVADVHKRAHLRTR